MTKVSQKAVLEVLAWITENVGNEFLDDNICPTDLTKALEMIGERFDEVYQAAEHDNASIPQALAHVASGCILALAIMTDMTNKKTQAVQDLSLIQDEISKVM